MIQSACATHSRSESNPPVRMRLVASGVKNGSGLSFRARSSPSRAARAEMSRRETGYAALPRCAAICAPIVPAPNTHADRIRTEADTIFAMLHSRRCSFNLEVLSMSLRFLVALAACCFSLSLVVAGQTRATTGDLGGTIVDQSSAVLPGATVTAQNVETNHVRSAMTDDRGYFLIPALPPGTYTVKAELQGFTPRTLGDVVVALGSLIDVRLSLNVAGGQEVVLVAGD